MSDLDATARDGLLQTLARETFDLVVIGGGITGAGILRDASARGLKVALLEAEDFSAGTSSKSTKLIHGGIRYLAQGHVMLVREAALERKRVHRIAPHLAEPRWLMLPARNRIEWLKYKIGVFAYEQLGQVEDADRHFDVSGESMASHEPLIDRSRYPYACVYREYLTDDSRLVLANVRAGIKAGGVAANKLPVDGVVKERGRVTGVTATCRLTGEALTVRARGVINAAGPWVESICQLDDAPPEKPLVLSKGVHIIVSRDKLPLTGPVMTITRDRRPVFLIPRHDVVYIGTTDSRYDSAETWPSVLEEEVRYLLEPVHDYCRVELSMDDVLTSWAGLRPLISQTGKSTREISRRDEIWISGAGLVTIAGGKLTGYRKMAEETVDEACRLIGYAPPAQSALDQPLPGGDFQTSLEQLALDLAQRWPMPESDASRLVSLYGTEAKDVLALGERPVVGERGVREGEVHWAVTREGASSVEDVLYRRTRTAYYAPAEVSTLIDPVGRLVAGALGWNEVRRLEDVDAMTRRVNEDSDQFRSS